jgi:hypothetical protein
MCEMIRALLFAGKLPNSGDFSKLNDDFVSKISCPGFNKQTQPCAVNDGSYFQESGWFMLLDGTGIQYGD